MSPGHSGSWANAHQSPLGFPQPSEQHQRWQQRSRARASRRRTVPVSEQQGYWQQSTRPACGLRPQESAYHIRFLFATRTHKGTARIRFSSVMLSDPITRSGDGCDDQGLNLYTLGYQGVDVHVYVQKLKAAGVGIVADVRETPWSHKRGFCKNILSTELLKAGIEYVHVRSAGNPKSNRRTATDLAECLKRYEIYLRDNPAGVNDLIQVVRTAASRNRTVCLTCFEKDVKDCHRSIPVSYTHLDVYKRQL